MKDIANSEVYVKVGFFRGICLRVKRAFSQKARDEMESVRATLAYAEELLEIERIREKAEVHSDLIQEVEAGQPEIIVMEGSIEALEEYEKVADMNHAASLVMDKVDYKPEAADDHAASLGMDKVDYEPEALDELYDPDELDKRIAEEATELTELIRRDKLNQC